MTPENHISQARLGPPLVDSDINWHGLSPIDAENFDDLPERSGGNALVAVLLNVIRLARFGGQLIHELREALRAAVAFIAQQAHALEDARSSNAHLRAQLRSVFSGWTIAAERQAIEDTGEADE